MPLFADDPLPSITLTMRHKGPTSPIQRFFSPIPYSPTWRQYRALRLLWTTGKSSGMNSILLLLILGFQLLTSSLVKWEIE